MALCNSTQFLRVTFLSAVFVVDLVANCDRLSGQQIAPKSSKGGVPGLAGSNKEIRDIGSVSSGQSSASANLDDESRLQARVTQLIVQLADVNYHQRETAKWELERIGLAAFEQLRQASQTHPNAHVARAAKYLIDSQDVVWWLETDSLEVRELLTTYNDSTQDDRDTILQQLSERGTADALLALCRLARYESNETRSKSAALYLMQSISEQLARESATGRSAVTPSFPGSMELTLGESNRIAAQWIKGLMNDLRSIEALEATSGENKANSHQATQSSLPSASLDRWQHFIAEEHAEVQSESDNKQQQLAAFSLDRFRSLAITLRFYRWLGSWVTKYSDREQALELVRPSVRLIGSEQEALKAFAEWALESELPELVVELAESYSEQFAKAPALGYMLAEGHLRLGDEHAAEAVANAASNAVAETLKTKQLFLQNNLLKAQANLDALQAGGHKQLADHLAERGMYQWAEREYLKAIEFDPTIREELAAFYWMGQEHQKAADILQPLAEVAFQNEVGLPTAPNDYNNPASVIANYYFYGGLAAKERGDKLAAIDLLRKSAEIQFATPNPDAVIAMKQLGTEEHFASYYREHFDRMSSNFRVRVIQAEEQFSRAADRMERATAARSLAIECNQLAWLLGKCEVNPEEAISLSLRSLELMPDDPAHLDTLARCYFSAGKLENAVRIQRRVVQLAPHERQLAAQLKEFEEALAKKQ